MSFILHAPVLLGRFGFLCNSACTDHTSLYEVCLDGVQHGKVGKQFTKEGAIGTSLLMLAWIQL